MSGRTKRILYTVARIVLYVSVYAAVIVFGVLKMKDPEIGEQLALAGCLVAEIIGSPVFLHELGHLLFGLCAGMAPVSFTAFCFRFSKGKVKFVGNRNVAGATAMIPRGGNVRRQYFALTVGGSAFGLTLGAILVVLWSVFPESSVMYFFGLLGIFTIAEGIDALLPAELPAGKTDGAVLLGLLKNSPDEEIAVRVLTAQGILYRGDFASVPESLFLGAPVVREDLPAFHALLFLEMQFRLSRGEEEDAKKTLGRLVSLEAYFDEEETADLERYRDYFEGSFTPVPSPLSGVNELEGELAKKTSAGLADAEKSNRYSP